MPTRFPTMNNALNILTLVAAAALAAFWLGFVLGSRKQRRELDYQRRMAEKWWTRCRELESDRDDADWWKQ